MVESSADACTTHRAGIGIMLQPVQPGGQVPLVFDHGVILSQGLMVLDRLLMRLLLP